jgi:predicted NAD-dependent protein-ADP-ribosyltransferase YbiA (DUF1768 family)
MDEPKPLNVWSKSDEEIGRLMSNFAHTPFELDGVRYASVEGFYSMLLTLREKRREQLREMWGVRAKRAAARNRPERTYYGDEWFELGSEQHHALIKRAIQAKLEAHPEIAAAFVGTRPRPLVHETGFADPPGAEFTKEVFCRILEELREELAGEDGSPTPARSVEATTAL